MKCLVCKQKKKTENHHLNYKENLTIPVCRGCHRKIHYNHFPEYLPVDTSGKSVIGLSEETKNKMDEAKVHPRETYDDLINRLLEKEVRE